MTRRIDQGDALAVLKTLPDGCVQTCVTSPPYWGLRDYGTATWDGGDPACDHGVRRWEGEKQTQGAQSGHASKADRLDRGECACGARRIDSQIGLEGTPEEYVSKLVEVFREVRRVLRDDGTLWLNLGDSYVNNPASAVNRNGMSGSLNNGKSEFACRTGTRGSQQRKGMPCGLKPKDLVGIPWRVAFALQADGWYLRQDIIWSKPNPMPESVTDRCTKAHEYIFLLTKSARYYYDAEAVREPVKEHAAKSLQSAPGEPTARDKERREMAKKIWGEDGNQMSRSQNQIFRGYAEVKGANRRSVWTVTTQPYPGAHFATFPPALVEPCIKAGTSERGCCSACGMPWERVVEKPEMPKVEASGIDRFGTGDAGVHRKVGQAYQDWRAANPDRTVGWRPSCDCNAAPVPCTVLDPFAGAGTTLLVATRLQRSAIGIELNPAYVKMARRRIEDDAPLFNRFAEVGGE